MPDSELITIGAFARLCGLSASALRFYADAGVLVPAVVDEATGYRYYTPDQAATAAVIRRLRAVDMPLPAVSAVLAEPDPARAADLVDAHLTALDQHLATLREAADAARAAVPANPAPAATPPAALRLRGPILAAALDQVSTATLTDPVHPVLDSIHLEAGTTDLTLTATDRYRLSTRTVRVDAAPATPWSITVDAADLRTMLSWLRRQPTITLRPDATGLLFTTAETPFPTDPADPADPTDPTDPAGAARVAGAVGVAGVAGVADSGGPGPGGSGRADVARIEVDRNTVRADRIGPESVRRCRYSAGEFPDYRAMLTALPPVRVRVVLSRSALVGVLESVQAETVTLSLGPGRVRISDGEFEHSLAAAVTGPAMTIHFAVTTLYPAVAGAVGPDLMLDLIAPDQPARIRSADNGTLLTLAMPRRSASAEQPTTS
ncbi:MerR family transcriptional regulator [Nocardia sp. SSK8]|uniref:MerR family transcriptional regulator n=1 Tax=Nocardia sp. SSK8 TaxID=3120154 RepID=UPI00300A10AF